MQQRGVQNSMEVDSDTDSNSLQTRGRVLVRSHAMREETSPPREPTPTALNNSPCIKLTPSSDSSHPSSPNRRPVLVLSPSISRSNSPSSPQHQSTTPILSPTNTLVPSPTQCHSPVYENQSEFTDLDGGSSPKVNNKLNARQERLNLKNIQKSEAIMESGGANGTTKSSSACANCARNNNNNFNTYNNNNNNNGNGTSNTLTVGRAHNRAKLRQQSSSQSSFDGTGSPCLSRDNSSEQYTDTTGVDLELFIPETLNRNAKDRALMLRIEEELVQLAKDKVKTHFKFPPMSSYQRMLVHRCAAYFGMDHNIESSGKCVVVNKTRNTRIPDVEFKHHIKEDIVFSEEPRRSILKRDSNSIEDYNFKSPDRQYSLESRRSLEEREEEYEKARRRIFNKGMHDSTSTEDIIWDEGVQWSSTDTDKYSHNHLHVHRSNNRLLKVHSEETGEETLRPYVAKSYSFGGYGGSFTRGDSVFSTHSAGPRLLTKQDSGASSVSWRLSPSSSGYKTQSQRSESITPSPTSTPFLSSDRQDSTATNVSDLHSDDPDSSNQVVWAVTNIDSVPKGSVIINPQTGQPIKNQDGSVYHHDPDNPLPELQPSPPQVKNKPPLSPVKSPPKVSKPQSPKKPRAPRGSPPIKKTNSATSPSLPFTPPLSANRFQNFMHTTPELPLPPPMPPQGPSQYYAPPFAPDNAGVPLYQPPCIVYAPCNQYPVSYDPRLEAPIQEIGPNYYNVLEGGGAQGAAPMAYPSPSQGLWPPQPSVAFYPIAQSAAQRFAVPVPQQGTTYITTPYPSNYIQSTQTPQPANPEMISVYPTQNPPVPSLYPAAQANQVFPHHQNVIYAQPNGGPFVYPPSQNISYPVNPGTPTAAATPTTPIQPQYEQMVQAMGQMQMPSRNTHENHRNSKSNKQHHHHQQQQHKNMMSCSGSHSSTENSSPATTVVTAASYGHPQYMRQPSVTPPNSVASNYSGNYVPSMFIRPMNNVRASPPVQNRTSRSPTPAGEAQRYPLSPLVYPGMSFAISSDARVVTGRGQPLAYRQTTPRPQHAISSNTFDNKSFRNKRARGNKLSSSNVQPQRKPQPPPPPQL